MKWFRHKRTPLSKWSMSLGADGKLIFTTVGDCNLPHEATINTVRMPLPDGAEDIRVRMTFDWGDPHDGDLDVSAHLAAEDWAGRIIEHESEPAVGGKRG